MGKFERKHIYPVIKDNITSKIARHHPDSGGEVWKKRPPYCSFILAPKAQTPSNHEKTSEKPCLTDILQNIWSVFFKSAKIIK